jgi:hypothetical protein
MYADLLSSELGLECQRRAENVMNQTEFKLDLYLHER